MAAPHGVTCSVAGVKIRRRTAQIAALVATASFGLSACTANMDMTIDASDTYDATLVMRDTTGSLLTEDTDCQDYADPSLVGASEGADVTSTRIGSADDEEGVGCEVKVTAVKIPDADEAEAAGTVPLVSRDGDRYIVTLAPIDTGAASAGGPDDAASSTSEPIGTDAHLSVTFPGAVIDAGGGSISGRTATWEGADSLANGVTASGYATPNEGLSFIDRFGLWIAGLVAIAGLAVGAAIILRRRRRRDRS
jgi:hypothetical protein avisC_04117